MRDAIVAGISLDIFNKHCDRVKLACIAQMVNVLQSVILTEGPKMILTPTYHVFHMYKYHQDADLVSSYVDGNKEIGVEEEWKVSNISESVSVSADGTINITLSNASISEDEVMEVVFAEKEIKQVKATILTQKMHAHNTFDNPEKVKEEDFDVVVEDGKIKFTAPACSVISIRVC